MNMSCSFGWFCGAHSFHSKAQEQSKHSVRVLVGSSHDNVDKLNGTVFPPSFWLWGRDGGGGVFNETRDLSSKDSSKLPKENFQSFDTYFLFFIFAYI